MKCLLILFVMFTCATVFAQYRTTQRYGNQSTTYDYGTQSYSTTTYNGNTSTTYDYGKQKYTTCTSFGNMTNCY